MVHSQSPLLNTQLGPNKQYGEKEIQAYRVCNFSVHAYFENYAGSKLPRCIPKPYVYQCEGPWDRAPRVSVPVTVLKVTGSKTVKGVSFNHEFLASAYSKLHELCFLKNQSGRLIVVKHTPTPCRDQV